MTSALTPEQWAQQLYEECLATGWYENTSMPAAPTGQGVLALSDFERLQVALAWMHLMEKEWRPATLVVFRQLLKKNLALTPEHLKTLLETCKARILQSNGLTLDMGLVFLQTLKKQELLDWNLHPAAQQAIGNHIAEQEEAIYFRMTHTGIHPRVKADFREVLYGALGASQLFQDSLWGNLCLEQVQELPSSHPWWDFMELLQAPGRKEPTQKWKKQVQQQLDAHPELFPVLHRLLDLLQVKNDAGNFTRLGLQFSMEQENLLRGMVWAVGLQPSPEHFLLLRQVAEQAYHKLAGIGPRNLRVGNTCVQALLASDDLRAVAHLEKLRQGTRNGTIRRLLDSTLQKVASSRNISQDDLLEMAVPDFALPLQDPQWSLGNTTVRLRLQGGQVHLHFTDEKGKSLSQPSKSARDQHGDEWKHLKKLHKELQDTLGTIKKHLESQYLKKRHWTFQTWLERFDQHPLWRALTRALVWQVDGHSALWQDGWTDAQGNPLNLAGEHITLWHPVYSPAQEVLNWRDRILQLELAQPFKQVFREVYLLTDAERNTHTYSNRFAAHILKQHQLQALAQERGWKYQLQGGWDGYNTPTRDLPEHSLTADFLVEGIPDAIGNSGIYLYLSSDQVRFLQNGVWNDPLPLSEVPPLVFSEVMRDVDLFVGVCSVGNDPNWIDSEANSTHRSYWQNYSFGELSATAETRKDLLTRLIPRLKIRDQASIEGRFLKVTGKLKTYKIHLGSSNILMEPNDQYLCIVPGGKKPTDNLPLAFEGDRTLSIILSKAFLLAEDHKITDPTITRQLLL